MKRVGLFLGEISYSVYLIHPVAHEALLRVVLGGLPSVAAFALGLTLTLTLTHR